MATEEGRERLSTEAWMVLNVLSQWWVQEMISSVTNIPAEQVVLAVREINQALGREG